MEFSKKIDNGSPFYYVTESNVRYSTDDSPSFDEKDDNYENSSDKRTKPTRLGVVGKKPLGRAVMLTRGKLSVRKEFHAKPVPLPPIII